MSSVVTLPMRGSSRSHRLWCQGPTMSLASGRVSRSLTQQSSVSSSNSSYQPATQQAGTCMLREVLPRRFLLWHFARQPKIKIHVDECVERGSWGSPTCHRFRAAADARYRSGFRSGSRGPALPRPARRRGRSARGYRHLSGAKSVSDHGRVDATQVRGPTDGAAQNCTNPAYETPNIPTLPVDQGWAAAHSTVSTPSAISPLRSGS